MNADANLSSDDMRVECLLDRQSNDPLLSRMLDGCLTNMSWRSMVSTDRHGAV